MGQLESAAVEHISISPERHLVYPLPVLVVISTTLRKGCLLLLDEPQSPGFMQT